MAPEVPAHILRLAQENLSRIRGRIESAAAGRPVTIVCVSKYASLECVEALLRAGATDLGENLLPAAIERFASLQMRGFRFTRHLIGAQQSRKLRLIPGNFDWLQALDSLDAAAELQTRLAAADESLNVLLQVNIGSEPQKHGFGVHEAEAAIDQLRRSASNLRLRGLMAIPPGPQAYADSRAFESGTRACFEQMRVLFDRIDTVENRFAGWDTLSLGMSQDYLWAVEAGATMLRIGTALFEGMEG